MKKFFILAISAVIALSSCNNFLTLKPLDKVSGDQLTASDGGLKALLANIYAAIPMEDHAFRPNTGLNAHNDDGANATTNINMLTDDAVRSDGDGVTVGPEAFSYWPWSNVRQVNLFFDTVKSAKEAGSISEATANRLTSEAHFVRAYMYYAMVKRLGGVPIIDHAQDKDFVPGDGSSVAVPRATELETWKFVLTECDKAAANLPTSVSGDEAFRATKWAALALKSRVALHAASVAKYWDKAPLAGPAADQKLIGGMSAADATFFYEQCIDASAQIINNSGKTLHGGATTDKAAALKAYQEIFTAYSTDEVLFGRAFVDGSVFSQQGHIFTLSYVLSQVNTGGVLKYGRFSPTLELVDTYEDYTDDGSGKSAPIKTRTDGVETPVIDLENSKTAVNTSDPYIKYNTPYEPFKDKDVRLLATMVVPGSLYGGTEIIMQGGMIKPDGSYLVYSNGSVEKDGVTYYALGAETGANASGFFSIGSSEGGNYPTTGFSIRKYMVEGEAPSNRLQSSTIPFVDMRLAEVYLNYAEAVVESGKGDATLAAKCINDLRHRAAHKDNIPLTLDNVLKERRVELALEGQRYWDLIRRREYHTKFDKYMRKALVPMIDLRGETPQYVFVRANFFRDERESGRTFQPKNYYRQISGTATNGLVQNP